MKILHQSDQNFTKVYIWIEPILNPSARIFGYLSDSEKERAHRYKTQKLCESFVASRGRLREVLGLHLGLSPEKIEFTYNSFGKPSIHPKHSSQVCFNISHSYDHLAIAITENVPVGIDLEHHSNVTEFYSTILSKKECEIFNNLTDQEKLIQLFKAWTLKEAYVKALGSGLNIDIQSIEVLSIYHSSLFYLDPFTLFSFPMIPNWSCAVAIEAKNPSFIPCEKSKLFIK